MSNVYLLALLFSLAGVAAIDFKFKLAFFARPSAALRTLAVPYLLLIIWDIVGIIQGIFYKGDSTLLNHDWQIAPNFPLEELFFLALLCYSTLLVVAAFGRRK